MHTPLEIRAKAAAAYDAAADRYDAAANTFWSRFGQATVERAALKRGGRVLDLCCGTGASALPAAWQVGDEGYVLGVDVSEQLLKRARAKAKMAGLNHVEFRAGDMLATGEPDESFDAVICVFGLFFVPDMAGAVRELWRMVRPGGTLVITTWGPRLFEPMNTFFWKAVRHVRPDLYRGFNPWDRIDDRHSVTGLFRAADIPHAEVEEESGIHPFRNASDWWTLVLGSGYRGTVDQLSLLDREYVRVACAKEVVAQRIWSVEANVVYATARKPVQAPTRAKSPIVELALA